MVSSNLILFFEISVLIQINVVARSIVANMPRKKAVPCQEELNAKLGLWISGRNLALIKTIGTSRNAIMPKTAQIFALRRCDCGMLALRIR